MSVIASFAPPRAEASSQSIADALEEDIVLGRLHPRERLTEQDLMAQFGAKRHTVRQALADLEVMGVVERIPNRGAQVRAYVPDAIDQIYAVRTLLECEAAAQVRFPAARTLIDDLGAIQAGHDAAVAAHDLRRAFRANVAFHTTLFAGCGNPILAEAIGDFARRVHGVRFYTLADPALLEKARLEHWAMIEALKQGDRKALIGLCRDHLPPAREAYRRAHLVTR